MSARGLKRESTWGTLYGMWQRDCESFHSPVTTDAGFIKVPFHSKTRWLIREKFDWWPKDSVAERRASIEQYGFRGIFWEIRSGISTTSAMLWHAQDDPELTAAVWLGASLWEKEKHPFESRLDREAFQESLGTIFQRLRAADFGLWHHATRSALPFSTSFFPFCAVVRGTSVSSLVTLAVVEASVLAAGWVPVRIQHQDAF